MGNNKNRKRTKEALDDVGTTMVKTMEVRYKYDEQAEQNACQA